MFGMTEARYSAPCKLRLLLERLSVVIVAIWC